MSVSSSASSALSGYSGGRSVGSSTTTSGRCQPVLGEVYTGKAVTAESEESLRADMRLRWPLRICGEFMAGVNRVLRASHPLRSESERGRCDWCLVSARESWASEKIYAAA